MIEESVIQEIKDRLDIVEVVGDFVSLKKSGSSYKALSPFTTEKTPSFFVSPSKQIFKCFSTGKGGDAIEFLKEVDSMTYIEAIKYLGEKYGVEINETESNYEVSNEKESLLIILNKSKEFFKENLNTKEGKSIAISYFDHRSFDKNIVEKFELGYSIDKWDSLHKYLTKNQYEDELIIKAGLILENNNKKYDRFRGRIIFPIHNLSGKVVAFGARILKDEKNQPKYINSPETSLYVKSKILYGLYQSKNNIRKDDNCYLVEGYTDVISLFQIDINNVVSSSGTSLTSDQIKLISRYTKNITILFDGDKAGMDASLRGMDLILENDMNVKIVSFPEGEDPDSYSKKVGKEKFKEFVKSNGTNLINYKINLLNKKYKDDPVKKSEMIFDIVRSISKIPNSIKRSVFLKEASNSLDIGEQALISEMNKLLIGKENKSFPLNNLITKKEENKDEKNSNLNKKAASLLIHAAKIDENYTEKEKEIIKKTLIDLGVLKDNVDKVFSEAEMAEKDANQILDFTREIKNADEKFKVKIVESLWNIIFSDGSSDMYESNFMRRLTGLIYLDNKIVGDIKEKIKKDHNK